MTTENHIDVEINPVNSSVPVGENTDGLVDVIIRKAYLRPEYAVLLSGEVSGELLRAAAARVYKVYLMVDHGESSGKGLPEISGLTNVETLLPAEIEEQIPEESMDAVIAAVSAGNSAAPLNFIKTLSALLRPAGRLVLHFPASIPASWKQDENQLRTMLQKAGLVNTLVLNEPLLKYPWIGIGAKNVEGARSNVRKRYQSLAEGSSCCDDTGPSCCGSPSNCCCSADEMDSTVSFNTGYAIEDIQPLPEESANLTLGCGNPIARANLQPGEHVLDIGSGAGIDVFLAARVVGEKGWVVGVDMTPAMLERARLAASKGKFTNVEFKQGHAESLPLENNTFDVVISNCVINLCEDKGRVFGEIFRVLRSGGRMVISDIVTDGDLPLEARLEAAGWAACISGALPHAEYLDLMRQAGFVVADTQLGISGGTLGDTRVYSLEITAVKP